MKTLIIAEAGVNHNGDLELAKKLIAEAAAAGADVVKFQTFQAKNLVVTTASKAEYQKKTTGQDESQFEMLRKLELSRAAHEALIEECRLYGIRFCSTAFDAESFAMLAELGGLELIKIPSGELTNLPFLRLAAAFGKPVILSTGMATLGDIEAALAVLEQRGAGRQKVVLLHCNTEYPTPFSDVNLRAMQNMRSAFGTDVGYSDHTLGLEIPIAAVALGAVVIEKHFTLDRSLPGPDHKASLEPSELQAMITSIRNVEQAMGDGIKRPSPSETRNMPIARRSLVAARPIAAGEVFSPENVAIKRPGTGLSPMRWDEVMGRRALRAFVADELIEL